MTRQNSHPAESLHISALATLWQMSPMSHWWESQTYQPPKHTLKHIHRTLDRNHYFIETTIPQIHINISSYHYKM